MTHTRLHVAAAAVLSAAAALLAAGLPGCGTFGDTSDPERRFYEARCGVCHVPFRKTDYTAEQWPGIVAQFAPRAGLTQSQRARILRYLTAAEPAAPPPAAPVPPPR